MAELEALRAGLAQGDPEARAQARIVEGVVQHPRCIARPDARNRLISGPVSMKV